MGIAGGFSSVVAAGCIGGGMTLGDNLDVSFEITDSELALEDPPDISAENGYFVARGTLQYASSDCGTLELVHAGYQESQHRLDLLIIAADDSGGPFTGCVEDLVVRGYRVEVSMDEEPRQIVATEHDAFGDTYSTTLDLRD